MTIFIIAVLAFAALSIFTCVWFDEKYDVLSSILSFLGACGCIVSLLGIVAIGFLSLEWFGAAQKAGIINREYGTQYTQAEVFYASSVIDTVRELDRKRYEVNGDFRRPQADPNVQARREQKK